MLLFIRQLIQLVLAPSRGWEDVSEAVAAPADIQRRGFYPFLALTGASEFLRLIYTHDLGFWTVLLSAIAVMGAMFVSLYVGRLFLDMTLSQYISGQLNATKVDIFATYMIGINCLFRILENAMPASMTFLKFLPLISLLIMFKATAYMAVKPDSQLSFLGLCTVAFIVLPIAMAALLSLLV